MQAVLPVLELYVPAAQPVQAALPVVLENPAAQGAQLVAPVPAA